MKLYGMGRYLPSRIVSNDEIAQGLTLSPEDLLRKSGVLRRHRADPAREPAHVMGARAGLAALEAAGLTCAEVDLILNASGTPLQALPDSAPFIQAELGLGNSGIATLSVASSCLSFLSALDVAASLLATHRYGRILVVSSDRASAGVDFSDPETAPLFGDGAAAAVVGLPSPGDPAALHAVHFETYGDAATLTEIPGGGSRHPPTQPSTTPEHGYFRMNGPALLRLAARHARPFLERLRAAAGGLDHDLLVPHQPSRAGLELFSRLGFPPERTLNTLTHFGNCVAASLPLSLHEAIASGRLRPGNRVLMLGTGAGISFGGALLTL
jgi:3-oxoacyl-[acyl-carrier-protein] synthase-3